MPRASTTTRTTKPTQPMPPVACAAGGPRGGVGARRSRRPPRILPEDDGRGRSARAILALAPRAVRSVAAWTHNGAVPERTQTAPALTGRFAAAFALAWAVHGTQLRKKTGIPYMAHVMSVAALALEHGADEDVAMAALLHDTVEDSEDGEATREVIEDQFGERVAGIVMACSDAVAVPGKTKPDWRERKETYLHHLEAEADADALLVSACDKVHNARSILADLRSDGDAVWQRFTVSDPKAQLWYYTSVLEVLRRRLPGPLTDELGNIVLSIAERIP